MSAEMPTPAVADRPGAKRRMLVYGNCQAGWLAQMLQRHADVAAQYEIVYLSDYAVIPTDHPIHDPGFLATRTDAVWQTASGCQPPAFLAGLPADCRQIRFPTLWLKLLWPTYAVDPRNQPEPEFPWGRYPYGDRLVMKLLREGVALDDLPKRYIETDLNKIVNLDRFTEMTLAELRFNDAQSDVAITPFIESSFRQRRLFGTVNHPTFLILQRIYSGVVDTLLRRTGAVADEEPADADDVLGEEETPLHPQIIRHFGLTWAAPGMRWRYRSAFLTLEEYLQAYGAFAPIAMGDPPALWLGRAQQAFARNNFPEAKRLLLSAATRYPELAQFLQYLAKLLLRQGKFLEAEKVIRYALERHPTVAGLHCDLGVALWRRNFPDEAASVFAEALRLDPAHAEARRNFSALASRRPQTNTPLLRMTSVIQ